MGVAPRDCLHIGDHREHDALGACAADLRGVWLDRPGDGTAGVERIAALSTLPALVAGPATAVTGAAGSRQDG